MTDSPVFEAAIRYVDNGYSIVPCIGKKASVAWTALTQARPSTAQVVRWRDAGKLQNVAIICGYVSGNLAVVDLDGEEAVATFAREFPSLIKTFTVRSGSGKGAHLYLRAAVLPKAKRTVGLPWGNVELRTDGCYVVAPPSIHPETQQLYTVSNRVPIKHVNSLSLLSQWIDRQNASKRAPEWKPEPGRPDVPTIDKSRWAAGALRAEAALVRHAPNGSRNVALNRAAYKMGRLVADNLLSSSDVETQLQFAAAALISEDGESSVLKTIRSGLSAGIQHAHEGKHGNSR